LELIVLKINKTITFGSKDEVITEKLCELGYFNKNFNFSSYVKNLIKKDVLENDGVFTKAQEDRVIAIVNGILQNDNVSITVTKNDIKKKNEVINTFEAQNEVALDKDDDDLLDFAK
jgi:hypothetical protein